MMEFKKQTAFLKKHSPRILKWIAWSLACILLTAGILFSILQTGYGTGLLVRAVNRTFLEKKEMTLRITNVKGVFPFSFRVRQISVSDRTGKWLEIDNLFLDISAGALLAGNLSIDKLHADRVRLERLPPSDKTSKEKRSSGFRPPSFVTQTILRDVRIREIGLGSPVLGMPARFSLEGGLYPAFASDGTGISLEIRRIDGEGFFRATVSCSKDSRNLVIGVSAEEPGKGILDHLTGIGEDFELLFQGEGELSDWKGRLEVGGGRGGRVQADIRIKSSNHLHVDLAGEFRFADSLPEKGYSALTGKTVPFTVKAGITDSRRVRLDLAEVEMRCARAELKGDIDLETSYASGSFDLKIRELSCLDRLLKKDVQGSFSLAGTFEGEALQPDVDLSFTLSDPAYSLFEASRIRGVNRVRFLGNREKGEITISGSGTVTHLLLESGERDYSEEQMDYAYELLKSTEGRINLNFFRIDSGAFDLESSGSLDGAGKHASLKLNMTQIKPGESGALPSIIRGKGNLELDLEADLETWQAEANLKGLYRPRWEREDLNAVTGDEVRFESRLTYENREAGFSEMKIETGSASLKGRGTYGKDGALDSRLFLTVPALGRLSSLFRDTPEGSLRLETRLSGTLERLKTVSEAAMEHVAWKGIKARDIVVKITHLHTEEKEKGGISIGLSTGGRELRAGTDFTLAGGVLSLGDLFVTGPGAEIRGAIDISMAEPLFEGDLKLTGSDLSKISSPAGMEIQGEAHAEAVFTAENKQQHIDVAASAEDLSLPQGRAGQVRISGNVSDLFGDMNFEMQASLKKFINSAITMKSLGARISGDKGRADFSLNGTGTAGDEFALKTSGSFVNNVDKRIVRIAEMEGEYGMAEVRLNQPFNITFSETGTALDHLDMGIGPGRIRGDLQYGPDEADADLTIEKIPLNLLSLAGMALYEGTLSGDLNLGGLPSAPRMRAGLKLEGIKRTGEAEDRAPALQAEGELTASPDKLSGKLNISGDSGTSLEGNLSLPWTFSLDPLKLAPEDGGRIEGSAYGNISLASIASLFGLQDHILSGTLDMNFTADGQYPSPGITGEAVIEGGYENPGTGVVLNDLKADISANLSEVTLNSISAGDGSGGTITGEGKVDISDMEELSYSLKMGFNSMHLLHSDRIRAEAGGSMKLSGTVMEHTASGALDIEQAEFNIPDKLPPDIADLEIEEINRESVSFREEIPEKLEKEARVNLDISVSGTGRTYIKGRGLDSEWEGRLEIEGTAEEPVITGNLSLLRGSYNFLSKQFNLRRGNVIFSGNVPPDPYFEVTGEIDTGEVTAIISLTGNIENPELSLSSDPVLPSEEILSRILFGRSVSQITPLQALRLASALNSLITGKSGYDPLGRVREITGLDRLQIERADGESTISAGKYINENIYLEVEKGIGNEGGEASVTWELTPHITVETEIGEDSETGAGLNWKFDY